MQVIKQLLFNKQFWKHACIALGVVIVLVIGLFQLLKQFTHHGEQVEVVDFKGKPINDLNLIFENLPFVYQITDSVFKPALPPGTVIDQYPAPGTLVKNGRTIFFTVNAFAAPKIKMPNFIDASLRQVEGVIELYGLKLGKTTYKPDFAKDAVLAQLINGKPIEKGALVSFGTTIDLVLGDGNERISGALNAPMLIGLTLNETKNRLNSMGLALGNLTFDEMLGDSANAFVYYQYPISGAIINYNGKIDLQLSFDKDKANQKSQQEPTEIKDE